MSDEDYHVEDLLLDLNRKKEKKKLNSGRKGKRGEHSICKTLIERFDKPFSRVIGSGAHGHRAALTEEAKLILTGDIVCPPNFRFTIESKHGYPEIDLCNALDGGHKLLDGFMEQVEKDAKRIHRKPLLCWKKNRLPCIAFIKQEDLPNFRDFKMHLCYNDWVAVALTELLKKDNNFFFEIP